MFLERFHKVTSHFQLVSSAALYSDIESLIRELFKPQLDELGITQPGSKFTFEDLFGLLEAPSNPQV